MTHPYQDPGRGTAERVADLLPRMTLEDKAGLLFHQVIGIGELPAPAGRTGENMLSESRMTHFNLLGSGTAREIALLHNDLQKQAEESELGIPVTLSTDPRHSFTDNPGTAMLSGSFSQWPETLGLAAIGDADLVRRHAGTVRREYLAVGLRVALHPQLDLATEPRWARISGTFGEDADLSTRLGIAYLEGLRGPGDGKDSVSAMVKHFPGGGPQADGEDPHFPYGKEQIYPGGFFDYHLRPFRAAIAAGATQIMPYYGKPMGTVYEEVAFGFNKGIITGLLREELGFDGIVCTDWGLLTDQLVMGEPHQARAWGVEDLDPARRMLLALEAGVDQFGGESCAGLMVELVRTGRLAESRIDGSAARLLAEKFRLGLFDDRRYVDPDAAEEIVGHADFRADGRDAQRRSLTLLHDRGGILPMSGRPRLYVHGIAAEAVAEYAELVATPDEADLAVLRLSTPYEPRPGRFESFFHAGRLDFGPERLKEILTLLDAVPTVVVIHLERPAVIPEIAGRCSALVASYGTDDRALLDVLFGRSAPEGTLPFQLPRSMSEVERGRPDVPKESLDPLFPFGHGLRYPTS
ncbi:glycoside hydrolase family 3 N-terminal domain-containing protein [Amycolatopsis sp. NPDC057786]|uniref:glycoside hydrolase family 3 protein n=1 Tax=Amycolatopsis sp. NPDC057786 TaxID=3346250 RepID=UPI00366CA29B